MYSPLWESKANTLVDHTVLILRNVNYCLGIKVFKYCTVATIRFQNVYQRSSDLYGPIFPFVNIL